MQSGDKQGFAEMLSEVMAYYGKDVSEFMLSVFWDGLKMHEFQDVSRAFTLHARDPDRGQWAPKVADITRLLEGSTSSQGMTAWSKVDRAIRSVGGNQSVVFDEPLIHAVIFDMGGWSKLCQTTVDDLPFVARDFERRFGAYRLRRELPDYPSHLIGNHEAQNRLNGFDLFRPVLIGDERRAMAVMNGGSYGSPLRITRISDEVARIGQATAQEHGKGQAA